MFDEFHAGDHLTLAINDEYAPAAALLGTATANRNPTPGSYPYNPTMDFPADGTTAGHAYWAYAIALRNGSGSAPIGTVDVRSEGFGDADAPVLATETGAGALTGGQIPAIPYTSETKKWGTVTNVPKHNTL